MSRRAPRIVLAILTAASLFAAILTVGCTRGGRQSGATPAAANRSGDALFQDVTARAGVRFVHANGASGHYHYIEMSPAGCAFLDYDNDGWQDILLIQSGPLTPAAGQTRPPSALYHNNGDGTFTDATAGSGLDSDLGYGHGVAVGDYDNDGYDDIFITAYNRNTLLHNEGGTGKFTDVTAKWGLDKIHSAGYATSAAFGDYDNDGKLDLYICYYGPWTPAGDRPCHDAQGNRDYCSPEVYPPDTHRLYRNAGTRFEDVSAKAGIDRVAGRGLAVAFLDYDGDGRQDIFVANDVSGNMLWRNEGDGRFTEKGAEAGCRYAAGGSLMAGMGVAVADYDRSGRESLFVTNFEAMPNMLFRNLGQGLMEDATLQAGVGAPHLPFLSFGCEFADYDADGWPDLLIANGHVQLKGKPAEAMKQRKQLMRNEGGRFREIADAAALGDLNTPTVARGLAVGDFDNDGRLDFLCSNQNGPPQLFRNFDRSANHWISFKTIGTKSNRDGLHTRFILTAGGQRRVVTVRAGSSYLSVSDRRVYFGLGPLTKAERVEIVWPSGAKDVVTDVGADQSYIVMEGKGVTGRLPGPLRRAAFPSGASPGR